MHPTRRSERTCGYLFSVTVKRRRPALNAVSRALTSMRTVAWPRRLRTARVCLSVDVPSLNVTRWVPDLGLPSRVLVSGALRVASRTRPDVCSEHASLQRKRSVKERFLPSLILPFCFRLATGALVSRAGGALLAGEPVSGVVSAVSLRTAAATLPSRTRQSTTARSAGPAP